MNYFTSISGAAIAAICLATSPAMAADNPAVAAEVIGLAKAQWAAEIAGRTVVEQTVNTAADYTEFNGSTPFLFVGKDQNVNFYKAAEADGSKTLVADMVNPKVQVYGDTAILSYNYIGTLQAKDGKTTPSNAKSTRVYVRQGGKWMLVHAHFTTVD